MEPQALAIVLLLAGFLLILAEFFIPSGGMIAVMCVASFLGSIYYAYRAWYHESPMYWWAYVASFMVLVPGGLWGALRVLTTTRLGDRILLRAPDLADVTPHLSETEKLSSHIGQRGKTLTLMSPGGMVLVNGERLHASVEGTLLEAGADIVVVSVTGNRVMVRPAAFDEPAPQSTAAGPVDSDNDNPLDPFDTTDSFTDDEQA